MYCAWQLIIVIFVLWTTCGSVTAVRFGGTACIVV